MKRIFGYIMALLAVSACQISSSEMPYISASDLENYGCRLFAKNVCAPLNVLEMVQALDEYLLLSDEEKENDGRFYGRVSILGDNVYDILDGCIKCVVNTNGKSLSEDGSVWEILNLHVRVEISQLRDCYYFDFDEDFSIGRSGNMLEYRTLGDGASANALEIMLPAALSGETDSSFTIAVSGTERTASFCAGFSVDSPMSVRRKYMDGLWLFDGTFRFNTYRVADNKALDNGSALFKPGYLTKFNVSR